MQNKFQIQLQSIFNVTIIDSKSVVEGFNFY